MKQRPASPPNYFRLVDEHPKGDDHPIDVAVRRRVPQEAAQQELLRLQRAVEAQLADRTPFTALETLRNNMRIDREEAYFNFGYEYGLADGVARASLAARSKRAKRLAREVRTLVVQAQLPPGEAVAALLECLAGALNVAHGVSPKTGNKRRARGGGA